MRGVILPVSKPKKIVNFLTVLLSSVMVFAGPIDATELIPVRTKVLDNVPKSQIKVTNHELAEEIWSPDGDLIDCIDVAVQPAFSHPLLKNHTFQETPTNFPKTQKNKDEIQWQVWHQNGTKCPEGTIPIRRIPNVNDSPTTAPQGHEYAVGFMKTRPNIYGTKVTMSVWDPKIQENSTEFSLGQTWVVSGTYNDSNLNSIEAGWQVYPELYRDNQPRLFIFWTNDAYNLTRCYNLRCAGFIQTSRTIVIEGAISQTSVYKGAQMDMTLMIWKDLELPLWWLGVGFNNGTVFEPVGYWPTEILPRLIDHAERVQWGGEIVNKKIYGIHTTTQMGSGYLSNSGIGKTAYMCGLEIAVTKNNFQPLNELLVGSTNPDYYTAKKSNETCFYYGGPESARAIRRGSRIYCFMFILYAILTMLVSLFGM